MPGPQPRSQSWARKARWISSTSANWTAPIIAKRFARKRSTNSATASPAPTSPPNAASSTPSSSRTKPVRSSSRRWQCWRINAIRIPRRSMGIYRCETLETLSFLSDLLQPLHFMDAGNFPQAGHDLFEVFEVGDIEDYLYAGLAVGGFCADVADVALGVADNAGDIFQHPETVVAVDGELDRVSRGCALVAGPFHVDAAFGLVHQVSDVGATHGMHRHSFAARDVADNAFSADGITTAGAVDQHIALALDHDRVVVTKDPAHHAGDGSGLRTQSLGLDIAGHRRRGAGRQQTRQHLPRGVFSVADAGHQVIDFSQAITGRNLLQLLVFDFFERDAIFARFFLDHLAADFDGTLPLVEVEPVLDLVARTRGLDQAQPVAAGLVAGLGKNLHNIAGMQLMTQRHHAAVHLGTDAGVADLGVNRIGKVDRRGVAGKHHHFALRREGVDLFGIEIDFQG